MADFVLGDVVVLVSGSMRMAVEKVESGMVHVVWSHEGQIGRDAFDLALVRKWEEREDRGKGGFGGDRKGGGRGGFGGGDRGRGGDRGGDRDGGKGGWGDKPRGKPGWDGKPRDKGYFRKD
ncbi:hypothetical protein ACMA5I_14450 [Paracoccaceae bacterium GXU_MW_L88]